jgi:hypothetical protein
MFDAVCAKQALIKQINSKSSEMVENWKQTTRDSRAEILGNRKRVMDQISFETIKLTPCKPTDSETTIEAKYNVCMSELKEKANNQVVEAWKSKAIESRRLIFATMHSVVAEIKTNTGLKESLKSTKPVTREDLMSDLKTKVEKEPEWKVKTIRQKCEAIKNKNLINCEIREFKFELNSTKNQVEKFNSMLDQIRSPTEAWKLKIQSEIANPHKNMRLVISEINDNKVTLSSTKNIREELMKSLRTAPVEAWKQEKADKFSKFIQTRKSVLCDISERNYCLKKIANRQALLADIRAAYNIPESWTFCESWKETVRNEKSKVLLAHKHCMVSVEQGKVSLRKTKASTRKEQLQACLEMIRKEPVEAWKKKVQESRISTIENKKMLVSEILNFNAASELKLVEKSVQNRKLAVNEEIKAKFNNSIEGWKQEGMNSKACQFFNKHIMLNELNKTNLKTALKKTQSIEQTKTSLMAAIRAKTNTSPVPEWQETERIERSKVQNNRNLVLTELRTANKKVQLGETKSLEQVKMQICKEIRANQHPIESWKEKERETQAGLYNNKRILMQAIANGVSCIGNKRSQAELKDALLVEIRSKGDCVVPEWKEKRMGVRAQVLKNKVALNAAICALKN